VHVRTIRATSFVGGYPPREGDDIDTILTFISTSPSIVFVIDDPLQAVHGRFIEFLCEQVVLKRACSSIRTNSNIDECGIRCRTVEIGLLTIRIKTSGCSHAHACCSVLMPIVRVETSIGFSRPKTRTHTSRVCVKIAYSIIPSDKLLVETRMFIINTRIDHGDYNTISSHTQVPCTGIERRVSSLYSRCLNISVEVNFTVSLNHDHIVKLSQRFDH